MNNSSLTNKRAFTLLELLFSVAIGSLILFSTLSILKVLSQENQKTFNLTVDKIDFETTRLFLGHKIKEDSTLSKLALLEQTLRYDGNILIQNVTSLSKTDNGNGVTLKICKNTSGEFCTEFYLQK